MLKTLPVKLSDDERRMKGSQLAQKIQEGDEIASALASVKSQYKAEGERVAKEITELARSLREGTEYRDVECEERFDFTAGRVSTVRLDTFETVETRPMKSEERQNKLFEEEKAVSEAPAATAEAQPELPLIDPEADNQAKARGFADAAEMDSYLDLIPQSADNDEKLVRWTEAGGNCGDLVTIFNGPLAAHHAARLRGFRDVDELDVCFSLVPVNEENAKQLEAWSEAKGSKVDLLTLFPEIQARIDEYFKAQENVEQAVKEGELLVDPAAPQEHQTVVHEIGPSMPCPLCVKERTSDDEPVGILCVVDENGEAIRYIPQDAAPNSIALVSPVRCVEHGVKPWVDWVQILAGPDAPAEATADEAPSKKPGKVRRFPKNTGLQGEAAAS